MFNRYVSLPTELPAGTTAGDLCGCSCPDPIVEGCTDEMAVNYNADANTDDGSCCMERC